jgi:hypothetical protein
MGTGIVGYSKESFFKIYKFDKQCYIKKFDNIYVFKKREQYKDLKDLDDEVFV